MKLNESNLNKTRIFSPINGIVLKRNVDPGQTVASSFQAPVLFTIAEDLQQMEVQVDVDEADVGKVRRASRPASAVDAYPDRRFPAVIREVRFASETVQGVVTYKAVLTVDNSELLLRPGMTATAEIGVQDVTDALLVPNAALRFSPPSTTSGAERRTAAAPDARPAAVPPGEPTEAGGPNARRLGAARRRARAVPVTVGAERRQADRDPER